MLSILLALALFQQPSDAQTLKVVWRCSELRGCQRTVYEESGAAFAPQAPPLTSATALLWEYEDAKAAVTVFEVCLDAQACVKLDPKAYQVERAADVPDTLNTYAYPLPALVTGPHKAVIKACSVEAPEVCESAEVGFRLIVAPGLIVNPRVKK